MHGGVGGQGPRSGAQHHRLTCHGGDPDLRGPGPQVTARLGLATPALRHWEDRGILQPAARRSGRRLHGPEQLRRIALIRIWRESGLMGLDEIATVPAGRTETGRWRDTVPGRMTAMDEQIDRLIRAKAYLADYLGRPRGRHGRRPPGAVGRGRCHGRRHPPGAYGPGHRRARLPARRPRRDIGRPGHHPLRLRHRAAQQSAGGRGCRRARHRRGPPPPAHTEALARAEAAAPLEGRHRGSSRRVTGCRRSTGRGTPLPPTPRAGAAAGPPAPRRR
ncbi:MerR family transcriptional regulator [Streptomyces sp. NPDC053069]|uniref:MerR family transcriptional regulator n=1 Tax=Streptomyces sp. NPDC053069 TaxID=3365695 RepID=UPI0037D0BABD